jgi:hypothetical protein
LNVKPKVKDNIIIRKEYFGALVYDPLQDSVNQVNEMGLFILINCNGTNSIKDIINLIKKHYKEIPFNKIKEDVINFIEKMKKIEIINFDSV